MRKAFYIIHCGIIDILQSYGIKKQMEALGKSLVLDGPAVSVSPPPFYGRRFRVYMTERVFKPSEDVGTEVICQHPFAQLAAHARRPRRISVPTSVPSTLVWCSAGASGYESVEVAQRLAGRRCG